MKKNEFYKKNYSQHIYFQRHTSLTENHTVLWFLYFSRTLHDFLRETLLGYVIELQLILQTFFTFIRVILKSILSIKI